MTGIRIKTTLILMLVATFGFACGKFADIPTEFPTPEPPPKATPLPKLELKRDAELEKQIAKIADEAKGKVGVAAVVLETGEAAMLNADQRFPMQSVYKLPIAMAMMEQIKSGEHDLDEKVGVGKEDMVREGQRSPLRDASPNGGEFTIRELIRLALVESDGTASDVLMRLAGGQIDIQTYLSQIGVRDIKIVNTEKEIGSDWQTQYENWATPVEAVSLLTNLCSIAGGGSSSAWDCAAVLPIDNLSAFSDVMRGVLYTMSRSTPGANRIKGLLPKNTIVAHKTGTSGTAESSNIKSRSDGTVASLELRKITAATNDIGIIYLPNGKHLAIAVFVSDSPADEKTREAVIARIAKAVWDRWARNSPLVREKHENKNS